MGLDEKGNVPRILNVTYRPSRLPHPFSFLRFSKRESQMIPHVHTQGGPHTFCFALKISASLAKLCKFASCREINYPVQRKLTLLFALQEKMHSL